MTGITEEDVGFPGSAFGFILERQQMAGQAGSVQQFHGGIACFSFSLLFVSHGARI